MVDSESRVSNWQFNELAHQQKRIIQLGRGFLALDKSRERFEGRLTAQGLILGTVAAYEVEANIPYIHSFAYEATNANFITRSELGLRERVQLQERFNEAISSLILLAEQRNEISFNDGTYSLHATVK